MTDRIDLRPGEDVAEWGYRTGRYPASRIGFWRGHIEAERRAERRSGRVMATANGFSPTELAIVGLFPVLAPDSATAAAPSLQRIIAGATTITSGRDEVMADYADDDDAEFAHLYPPATRKRKAVNASGYAEMDELDREVARLSGPPRNAASASITDDEWAILFPPGQR